LIFYSDLNFWVDELSVYPFLNDVRDAIRRSFGPADLAPLLAAAGIDATILVQARSSLEETEEFLATAAATPFIRGVVGWVDLRDPAVGETIARLRAGPGGDRLVGIRHQVQDEEDPDWLARDDVRRGIETVGRAGLVFDLLVRSREMPAARDVVAAMPDVRFVVDHLAKPPIREGARQPWADLVTGLGGLPNTWWKMSGLVTEADWRDWRPADLRPYVEHVLAVVGPERLKFGSDWPVCLLAASYPEVVAAAHEALGGLSEAERAAVFGGTAVAVYDL
jgi:L-fuconolactonase